MSIYFTYKTITSKSKKLVVNKVTRGFMPPIRSKTVKIPNVNGVRYFGVNYDERHIEIDIEILAASRDDLRTKVNDLFTWLKPANDGTLGTLSFSDSTEAWKANLDGETDWEDIHRRGKGTLVFLVPSGFPEGVTP